VPCFSFLVGEVLGVVLYDISMFFDMPCRLKEEDAPELTVISSNRLYDT